MNGKRLTALCLAFILSMSVIACQKTEEVEAEAEAERVAVEVQTPRVGMLSVDTAYIGTVAPQEQVCDAKDIRDCDRDLF